MTVSENSQIAIGEEQIRKFKMAAMGLRKKRIAWILMLRRLQQYRKRKSKGSCTVIYTAMIAVPIEVMRATTIQEVEDEVGIMTGIGMAAGQEMIGVCIAMVSTLALGIVATGERLAALVSIENRNLAPMNPFLARYGTENQAGC